MVPLGSPGACDPRHSNPGHSTQKGHRPYQGRNVETRREERGQETRSPAPRYPPLGGPVTWWFAHRTSRTNWLSLSERNHKAEKMATGCDYPVVLPALSRFSGRTRAELEPSGNVRGGGSCWVKRTTSVLPSYAYPVARLYAPGRKERRDVETCGGTHLGLAGMQDDTVTTFPCETGRGPWSMGRDSSELRDNLHYLTCSR